LDKQTEKWRKNHEIPIDDVVQQTVVYCSTNQTRAPQHPSRQMLQTTFGTMYVSFVSLQLFPLFSSPSDEREIIGHILEKGDIRLQTLNSRDSVHEKTFEK